jgi:hypothetical protein
MTNFKIGKQVIVSDHGVKKLGIVIGQLTKQKSKVYNVRMENGVEHYLIKVDNKNSDYYIDSELSSKFAVQIATNLTISSNGNFKQTENSI